MLALRPRLGIARCKEGRDLIRGAALLAVFTTQQGYPIAAAAIALSIAPILIEARKSLDPTEDEFDPVSPRVDCQQLHGKFLHDRCTSRG